MRFIGRSVRRGGCWMKNKFKKVVLFIVEGPTDKLSLGEIMSRLYDNEQVRFYVYKGDLTLQPPKSGGALKQVQKVVQDFLNQNPGIYRKDIRQIIHLTDTDGCYIGKNRIFNEKDRMHFTYTEHGIYYYSREQVMERNESKRTSLDLLSHTQKIGRIPYRLYYMSCNLEHVLHGIQEVKDNKKREMAEQFADRFYGREREFIDFIRDPEIAVRGDYGESWRFIRQKAHSLQRNSNFHLAFEEFH